MPSDAPLFNLFDHPVALMSPAMLSPVSAWVEHIPFAFLLMDLARPRTFVELGTHSGVSYCAFCQAVSALKLQTRCWAVDLWQGDPQAGWYSQEVLAILKQHHDPRYSTFSTLLQSTFDQAANQFEPGSIDLLHIDGLHTYEAVRHDFDTWKPRLSDRAIVLFHDTAETQRDFGVHRLWAELEGQFPSFEFRHGHGLGVLAVGSAAPAEAIGFLQYAREHRDLVRQMFAGLGSRDMLRCVLSCIFEQWKIVNDWKRRTGRPVDTAPEQFQNALYSPTAYARALSREIRELIRENQSSRG